GGVWRVKPESRGRKTPAMSPWSVCTSGGLASNSEEMNPPRVSSSSVPSSRIPVTRKPISSRCAMTTTTGLPWPTRTHRLPVHHRAPLADSHPQVARGVGLALGPTGQQAFHRLPYRTLGAGDTVGFDERGENGLGLRDSSRVLGGQAVRRTGGQKAHRQQDVPDRPSHRPPVRHYRPSIHCRISRTRRSASARATVSTAVSA